MDSINLLELPSLPLSELNALPKKVPAIYFVISSTNEVLYIGRAFDLNQRWSNKRHQHQKALEQLDGVRVSWLQVDDRNLLPELEYEFIERFTPLLNSVNNARRNVPFKATKPREKTFHIRFTEAEWERLEREATKREVTAAQVIRDLLKGLDKDGVAVK